jgi:hypothetical protein
VAINHKSLVVEKKEGMAPHHALFFLIRAELPNQQPRLAVHSLPDLLEKAQ